MFIFCKTGGPLRGPQGNFKQGHVNLGRTGQHRSPAGQANGRRRTDPRPGSGAEPVSGRRRTGQSLQGAQTNRKNTRGRSAPRQNRTTEPRQSRCEKENNAATTTPRSPMQPNAQNNRRDDRWDCVELVLSTQRSNVPMRAAPSFVLTGPAVQLPACSCTSQLRTCPILSGNDGELA